VGRQLQPKGNVSVDVYCQLDTRDDGVLLHPGLDPAPSFVREPLNTHDVSLLLHWLFTLDMEDSYFLGPRCTCRTGVTLQEELAPYDGGVEVLGGDLF
jgi:hypothetical protein